MDEQIMKTGIVSIQELLLGRNEDFDKAAKKNRVKLVRHKDSRRTVVVKGRTVTDFSLYATYKTDRQLFLDYQSEQAQDVFKDTDFIAVFLGEESTTARFINVFKVNKRLAIQYPPEAPFVYDLSEMTDFEALEEKIIIDWGRGTANWLHRFASRKEVIRIDRGLEDSQGIPYFTCFEDVNLPFETLKKIIETGNPEWKRVLTSVNCIYMITDSSNGKQYVGQTSNSNGIWGRWAEYVHSGGHGKDKDLIEILKKNPLHVNFFSWIILEILPLHVTRSQADRRESLYKEKFLTRKFGYNNN